jgi:hypothetical protein
LIAVTVIAVTAIAFYIGVPYALAEATPLMKAIGAVVGATAIGAGSIKAGFHFWKNN